MRRYFYPPHFFGKKTSAHLNEMCISAVNLLPNRAHHFFGRKTTPFLERNAHFWTVSAPNLLLIRAHHVFGRKTTPFLERNIANPLILHQKPMVFIKTIGCHRFRLDPFCSRPRRVSVYHFLWLNDVVSLDRIIEPLNCVSHFWIAFAYLETRLTTLKLNFSLQSPISRRRSRIETCATKERLSSVSCSLRNHSTLRDWTTSRRQCFLR